jgi:hypothetical protein
MKRGIVLGLLLAAGTIGALKAQQQGPKVIDVDKVKDNLYVLKGGGGNTASSSHRTALPSSTPRIRDGVNRFSTRSRQLPKNRSCV